MVLCVFYCPTVGYVCASALTVSTANFLSPTWDLKSAQSVSSVFSNILKFRTIIVHFSCFFTKIFLLSNRLIVSRLTSCRLLSPLVSRLASHVSRLTSHVSRLTSRVSRLASRVSRLASRVSRLTSHVSRPPPVERRNGVAIAWFDMRR